MDKIICVGKNYLEHAKELGDAVPDKPLLFLKPRSSLFQVSESIPRASLELDLKHGPIHYECELVFRISREAKITEANSLKDIFDAFAIGLDLTKRDLQSNLKKSGHPWEIAKVFKESALISPWQPLNSEGVLGKTFSMELNGVEKQRGCGKEMSFSPLQCLKQAAEHFPICPGDLLFTGTPKGVGPLAAGDEACLLFEGQVLARFSWAAI